MLSTPPSPTAATWLGVWSKPPDVPAQVALAVAAVLLIAAVTPGGPRRLASALDFAGLTDLDRRRRFLAVASFSAAFLSLGYLAVYLRGGPRAPVAASLWLQGRVLSHGALSWVPPGPLPSFRPLDALFVAPDRLAGVCPPGYPLLLAAAFLLGAPMLVGPVLAAGLVIVTWALARELATASGLARPRAELVARAAAGLSIVSVGLRHATADAVPSGAIALGVAATLTSSLRQRRSGEPRWALAAGLAAGALWAVEPAAAIGATVVALGLAGLGRARVTTLGWIAAGAAPGVALLLAANHAATGHFFASPASALGALAGQSGQTGQSGPAPLGGAGTPSGLASAARALRMHLEDVACFEPLTLLALVPLAVPRGRTVAAGAAVLLLGAEVAVALPGLAHGSAEGAGAVALAGALPLEHALIALALAMLAPERTSALAAGVLGIAAGAFAVHGAGDQRRLGDADAGRPRFEPDVVRESGVTAGLLFFDDDEAFELAHDPRATPSHGVLAVRQRGDDADRLVYESLGRPPTHRYLAPRAPGATATVPFWTPPGAGDFWRFEAEAGWPPASVRGGRAERFEAIGACASDGRGLTLTPDATGPGATARLVIELPVPRGAGGGPPDRRTWLVTPRAVQRGSGGAATLALVLDPRESGEGGDRPPLALWSWSDAASGRSPTCEDLPAQTVELGAAGRSRAWLVLTAKGGPVTFDRTLLRPR
jgi:hypothetical protein